MLEVAAHPSSPGREAFINEADDGQEIVGIDLHPRRSVLVRMTADARKLPSAGIPGAAANRPPGPAPDVAGTGQACS